MTPEDLAVLKLLGVLFATCAAIELASWRRKR
jgi:hypothetical protein